MVILARRVSTHPTERGGPTDEQQHRQTESLIQLMNEIVPSLLPYLIALPIQLSSERTNSGVPFNQTHELLTNTTAEMEFLPRLDARNDHYLRNAPFYEDGHMPSP